MCLFNLFKRKNNNSTDDSLETLENKCDFIFGEGNWYFFYRKEFIDFPGRIGTENIIIEPESDEEEMIMNQVPENISCRLSGFKLVIRNLELIPLSPPSPIKDFVTTKYFQENYKNKDFIIKNIKNFKTEDFKFVEKHNIFLYNRIKEFKPSS